MITRKHITFLTLLAVLCASACGAAENPGRETVYQVSTINALMGGLYDGYINMAQLKSHGNFGLGTFDKLNGEMIVLDGKVYQVTGDGVAHAVKDTMTTPFAAVTFFDKDQAMSIQNEMDYATLLKLLDSVLPSKNYFYAVRIDGLFSYVKTRSEPAQQKPYRELTSVLADQPTFDLANVNGTVVAMRCPAFAKDVNVAGYHLHFITADRAKGGHVLDCRVKSVKVYLDVTPTFVMDLPRTKDFADLDLSGDKTKDVSAVENSSK